MTAHPAMPSATALSSHQAPLHHAPDQPSVQVVTYGLVVLAGVYGSSAAAAMPELDTATIAMATQRALMFYAAADGRRVTLLPVVRVHHQHYTVYWNTTSRPSTSRSPVTMDR